MNRRNIGSAPDYTNAALIMLAVNLIWVFGLLWAVFGFIPVLLIAAGLHHGIDRLSTRHDPG